MNCQRRIRFQSKQLYNFGDRHICLRSNKKILNAINQMIEESKEHDLQVIFIYYQMNLIDYYYRIQDLIMYSLRDKITPIPIPAKLTHLAQEFADMSNQLPNEHSNSIFVRANKDRVDAIKTLIIDVSGTPQSRGAYFIDIYFEDQYPITPLNMNLSTTEGGKVRFNPNLYACGKVCLSLLEKWRHASEN
ncbi:unnamed protein product [Paramecium sonneborni]|uniref:UBC core domain-containing protein n=1 Tax=Paramecium sonneborni TaxID=65129 RepID=A0A8S1RSH0_9CILI|nr:unnamed protein product [Paramecium sonneborni]